jgi:hypothetical protein
MSSGTSNPSGSPIDDDADIQEGSEERVLRLTTLLQDLQAHTDALYELAKAAKPRAERVVDRSGSTLLRAEARARRSR